MQEKKKNHKISLMKLKKFKVSDYKKLHPGGSLGVKMLQVQDIMHLKNKIPIVSENASMKTIIIEMTKKSFGHVGVKNKKGELIGVITDGDLRRNINNHLIDSKAKMIMTQRPKLVNQNILVIDALNIMNKNKITCLFVVDKEKNKSPIGIVHIHDCIRYVN